ncbi:MAG: SH3 domain-containing protein [Acidobacteria bacterium]|nr:SH3 domain-containing protein [Acidobacteriota bacterium]
MRYFYVTILAVLAGLTLASCSEGPEPASAIGEAYAGPITLTIRQEIGMKSPVVATVKHGDQLEVLAVRRRFMRVRTPSGKEGWCDSEKLLTTEQMSRLRAVADAAAKLPSQAEATVFDARNVHTEPHRQSPSFLIIKEEEKFQVLAHKLIERGPYESEINKKIEKASAPPPRKKPARVAKSKDRRRKDGDIELPPMPPPPPVPANWRQLSMRISPEEAAAAERKEKEKSPLAMLIRQPHEPPKFEDWSLIRTKDGKAGWILTRTMTMTIPDDVARYAEGHRITSWFPLGEVHDEDVVKKHYLWTTIAKGGEAYEYDGFRIFVYNARRHRYETGYREKNVKGYFPSALHPVEVTEGRKTHTVQGFSLIVEEEDGSLMRRAYSFEGYRVRLLSKTPWTKLDDPLDLKALAITRPANQKPEPPPGLWDKVKKKLPWNKKS